MNILKNYFITIILFLILYTLSNQSTNTFYYPIKTTTTISSYYGYRNLFGKTHFHNGIDIPVIHGTNVYAINNGIVKDTGFSKVYGIYIILEHSNNYKSLYGHLDENILIQKGDIIYANSIIAQVGPKYLSNGRTNGMTTGSHLHFTIYYNNKHINPLSITYKEKVP